MTGYSRDAFYEDNDHMITAVAPDGTARWSALCNALVRTDR